MTNEDKHTSDPAPQRTTNDRQTNNSDLRRYLLDVEELEFGNEPSTFDLPSKYARRYLAYRTTATLQHKILSEGSAKRYESRLREWINFVHNLNKTVLEVQLIDFIEFIRYCIEIGRRTNTVMNRVSTIKNFYEYLVVSEKDVSPTISPIKIETIDREAVDDLTVNDLNRTAIPKEKVEKLFDAMNSERDRLMTIVAVETGFRNSDIRGIRLMDIDTDSESPEIKARDPKYGDSYTVPISQELALELDIWIRQGRRAFLGGKESDYLFPSERGGMIEQTGTLGRIIREAADEAGIQGVLGKTEYETEYMKSDRINRTWHEVVPHTLRHTFITLLEKEGVPLEYRQLLANHKDPKTTQRYSHGKEELLQKAQDRINLNY